MSYSLIECAGNRKTETKQHSVMQSFSQVYVLPADNRPNGRFPEIGKVRRDYFSGDVGR